MENDATTRDTGPKPIGSPRTNSGGEGTAASMSPKSKRRKVNHACIYCRRSHMTCDLERPCTRCIKRNIGHLCHDEPREPVRRQKGEPGHTAGEDEDTSVVHTAQPIDQQQMDQQLLQEAALDIETARAAAQPPVSNTALSTLGGGQPLLTSYYDSRLAGQNQFHDMHHLHPSYMFHAPEVTNEYNLLNDFLSTSLLEEGGMYSGDETPTLYSDIAPGASASNGGVGQFAPTPQPPAQLLAPPSIQEQTLRRASITTSTDKAQETYYMTAADPTGNDAPDARINKLLKAKYDAGLLRPFNYVKGYARLNKYMDQHMQPGSRQKILRQLDKFRPKFRERMQSLTDVELVLVEMWFERCLMEYDRVFASMAVPACCWRRTGEIFRGNKEMAELIQVPIEKLRDGKLAIHEIIVEDHLVNYWDKFGEIAFDNTQKAMLTSCSLKSPDLRTQERGISCCFSFTVRRDEHNIPSLIVGNFLPMNPSKKRNSD